MNCSPETFASLARDAAHWEFELFLMLLVDGLIGAVLWPVIRHRWKAHHEKHHPECA
jgi:hypothetical protein